MNSYPRNNELSPGTWKGARKATGELKAMFACPVCGQVARLDHDIAPDGTVSPSVVCPVDGCSFHEFIRLEGWKDD